MLYEHVFISRQDLGAQAEGLVEHFGQIFQQWR